MGVGVGVGLIKNLKAVLWVGRGACGLLVQIFEQKGRSTSRLGCECSCVSFRCCL